MKSSIPHALPYLWFVLVPLSAQAQAPVPLTIASASGQSQYLAPGKTEPALAAAGVEITPGTELRTGENGEMTLIVFPRLAVTLKAGSRLRVEERDWPQGSESPSALLDLPEGRIVVLLSDPPAGQQPQEIDLKIRTPQGIARPRGTFYALLVKDGKSYLAVREGMVGLEQFQPLPIEEVASEKKLPERKYGVSTTTSPRG